MYPPFMNATGFATKVLDKIINAQQPERFTLDYLNTKLGFDTASARPIIPLLKRIGFLASDGTPTSIYSRFRNPQERGRAMAEALHVGYKDVYERNEYVHDLPKDKFKNLIVEITGLKPSDPVVSPIVATFFNLKAYANFNHGTELSEAKLIAPINEASQDAYSEMRRENSQAFNFSYTINLNLPETTDVEVFNAIFRSLKEHLLKG